jgi:hypothetical protein
LWKIREKNNFVVVVLPLKQEEDAKNIQRDEKLIKNFLKKFKKV